MVSRIINFTKLLLAILVIVIFSTIIYSLTLKGILGNPTAESMKDIPEYSLRDRGRFVLIENLVQYHSFALNRAQAQIAAPDAGYYKGNWYLLYPPGMSIIAVPFYQLGYQYNLSQVAVFAMGGLFSMANLVLIFLISKQILKLPVWAGLFAALVFGFASDSLGYSTNLFQHQITAFFILSGFYAVYQYKIHQIWGFIWGFWVWVAYGLTIFVDYPNALLMLPVMVYFFLSSLKVSSTEGKYHIKFRLALILTSVFFIAISAAHGYYNQVNFGGWSKLSGSLSGFREGVAEVIDQGGSEQDIKNSLNLKKNNVTVFFKENYFVNGAYVLLLAPDKGLFVYSPIFFLGFLGILLVAVQKKANLEISILASLVLFTLFLYSSWGDPWGGWSFGPRYLIPGLAPLAIFVGYWLAKAPDFKFLNFLLALILFFYSAGISVLGAVTTNVVPPKSEADVLHQRWGIDYNIDYISQSKTSSLAYNYYFHNNFTLWDYYLIIAAIVCGTGLFVLTVLPLFSRPEKTGTEKKEK